MLGRVRPPPSSLDCLETERSASKLIKDDTFSIYEATLEKLRLGSRRALISSTPEAMTIDDPSSSPNGSPSCSDGQSQSTKSPSQDVEESSSSSLVRMQRFRSIGEFMTPLS